MKTRFAFPLVAGSFIGALAVIGGAFGTHALREVVSPERIVTYQTAMSYMLAHAILLVAMASIGSQADRRLVGLSAILVFAGICVFSGSLILLVLLDAPLLGMVTPVGGVLLIAGWISLGLAGLRNRLAGAD